MSFIVSYFHNNGGIKRLDLKFALTSSEETNGVYMHSSIEKRGKLLEE